MAIRKIFVYGSMDPEMSLGEISVGRDQKVDHRLDTGKTDKLDRTFAGCVLRWEDVEGWRRSREDCI